MWSIHAMFVLMLALPTPSSRFNRSLEPKSQSLRNTSADLDASTASISKWIWQNQLIVAHTLQNGIACLLVHLSICQTSPYNGCLPSAMQAAAPDMKVMSSPQWSCSQQSYTQPLLCSPGEPAGHCNSTSLEVQIEISNGADDCSETFGWGTPKETPKETHITHPA